MANYVDKESLIKYVDNAMTLTLLVADPPDDKLKEFYLMVKGFVLDYISIAPTADVKPMVRGSWIGIDDEPYTTYKCDKCGYICEVVFEELPNYCLYCGADLRGADDDR